MLPILTRLATSGRTMIMLLFYRFSPWPDRYEGLDFSEIRRCRWGVFGGSTGPLEGSTGGFCGVDFAN